MADKSQIISNLGGLTGAMFVFTGVFGLCAVYARTDESRVVAKNMAYAGLGVMAVCAFMAFLLAL